MQTDIYRHIEQAIASGRPFAVATVIAVRGSSSAKPGSKALIDAEGRNVFGWVGGGCADAYVRSQAREAMAQGCPRIVQADLDDEVFGLGMPCGGVMDVFIEPQAPAPVLALPVAEELRGVALEVAHRLNVTLDIQSTGNGSLPEMLLTLAKKVALQRGKSGLPMTAGLGRPGVGMGRQAPSAILFVDPAASRKSSRGTACS